MYLLKVIKTLEDLGDFKIDIATLNIHDIHNRYHFCTDFSPANEVKIDSFGSNIIVRRFDHENLAESEKFQNSKTIFSTWYREFIDLSLKYLKIYDRALLLGGWNFPEKAGRYLQYLVIGSGSHLPAWC